LKPGNHKHKESVTCIYWITAICLWQPSNKGNKTWRYFNHSPWTKCM